MKEIILYIPPTLEIIDISIEGSFCQSPTEGLNEEEGRWS